MSIDIQKAPADLPRDPQYVESRGEVATASDTLHLAELVPVVRERLGLGGVSDDVIMTCLKAIAAQSEPRERWRAAFSSRLGEMLSRQGRDLNTALNTLLALLPRLSS